ncbi:MAG: apolipoprotein N-acyltransferase [Pontiellaceae bacterium]|nr:apolipoprotein N-acyltransferase [Pontiellaceae bacterium]
MIGSLKEYYKRRRERGPEPVQLGEHPLFRTLYARVVGSILSGILLALAFPGAGFSLLAFAAMVPLMFAVQSVRLRRAAWLGLLSGVVFYMCSLSWLSRLLGVVDSVGLKACAVLGYAGLSIYCALYFIPFAMICSAGIRRWVGDDVLKNVRFMLAASVVWVALEYFRSVLFTGFPWNALGVSQYTSPALIQIAGIGGVYMVSALVVWMNMSLFVTLRQYTHGTRLRKYRMHFELMIGLALVALTMMYGLGVISDRPNPNESVRVGIVQPNVEQTLKNGITEQDAVEMRQTLRRLSLAVDNFKDGAGGKFDLDLIVWPETALPDPLHAPQSYASRALVNEIVDGGTPLLVGTIDFMISKDGTPAWFNSSVLIGGNGNELMKYDKQHLVPFGEYVPFPGIRKFTAVEGDLSPGLVRTVFPLPDPVEGVQHAPFSVLICFEDTVAPLASQSVRDGARWLVNQTNDGWFDPSAQSEQHLAHAVFRCVENRVSMVRCCNTGVSGLIDAGGTINPPYPYLTNRIKPQTEGYAIAQLVPRYKGEPLTFYTRRGDLFAHVCVLLSISTLIVFRSKGYKRRKKQTPLLSSQEV